MSITMKSAKGKDKDAKPWTSTGSFIKKPQTGWLHGDRDLMNGSSITYTVRYLGCCTVTQSMRTLQYAARTAVTREAIMRVGEASGKILPSKKRKIPKQLNKLLGTIDTRWGDDINLSISVDSLQLLKRVNEKEIVNHELSSISFAAGGEGITLDYIGYVAKDPIHDRACHVFDCPEVSHLVLSTIGQAFELRYKLYLNQPTPNPLSTAEGLDGDTWGSHPSMFREDPPDVPGRNKGPENYTMANSNRASSKFDDHIYDQSSAGQRQMDFSQDGVYNNPGDVIGATGSNIYDNREGAGLKSRSVHQGQGHSDDTIGITTREENLYSNNPGEERGDNPYDDPHALARSKMGFSEDGVYDNPSQIGGANSSVYDNKEGLGLERGKIRQLRGGRDDQIGITTHAEHDYVEPPAEVPMGFSNDGFYDNPGNLMGQGQSGVYDNKEGLGMKDYHRKVFQEGEGNDRIGILTRDESIYSNTKKESANQNPDLVYTQDGVYDNPSDLTGDDQPGVYDNKEGLGMKDYHRRVFEQGRGANRIGILTRDESIYSNTKKESGQQNPDLVYTQEGVYDNPGQLTAAGTADQEGIYDNKSGVLPNKPTQLSGRTPSFDDPTYASIWKKPAAEKPDVDISIPLNKQQWYHGTMSRIEAEALLEDDGEFLIRESKGKYVLTAKGDGRCHHLLLVDDRGKVKARDKEFKSVPDLVHYFTSSKMPLSMAGVDVFLTQPVLTAFP